MSIQTLHHSAGHVVNAQFRLTACRERRKADGQRFQILQLEDATGSISAMVWPSAAKTIGPLPAMPCYVEVTGKPREFNGQLIMDVHHLHKIEAQEIAPGALLLPRSLCPEIARPALRDLVEFHASLGSLELKGFVARALHDEAILEALFRCPASRHRHHAYPGGLLVHSAGPLAWVKTLAEDQFQDDTESVELTQVAYLFHGLGKALPMRSTSPKKTFLSPESLTTKILLPHLQWLSARCHKLAAALGEVFEFVDQPAGLRQRATFAGAEVVSWVGQHNASLSVCRGLELAEAPRITPGYIFAQEQCRAAQKA